MNWSLYHYEITFLVSAITFAHTSMSNVDIATPAFLLVVLAWYIFLIFLFLTYLHPYI